MGFSSTMALPMAGCVETPNHAEKNITFFGQKQVIFRKMHQPPSSTSIPSSSSLKSNRITSIMVKSPRSPWFFPLCSVDLGGFFRYQVRRSNLLSPSHGERRRAAGGTYQGIVGWQRQPGRVGHLLMMLDSQVEIWEI